MPRPVPSSSAVMCRARSNRCCRFTPASRADAGQESRSGPWKYGVPSHGPPPRPARPVAGVHPREAPEPARRGPKGLVPSSTEGPVGWFRQPVDNPPTIRRQPVDNLSTIRRDGAAPSDDGSRSLLAMARAAFTSGLSQATADACDAVIRHDEERAYLNGESASRQHRMDSSSARRN